MKGHVLVARIPGEPDVVGYRQRHRVTLHYAHATVYWTDARIGAALEAARAESPQYEWSAVEHGLRGPCKKQVVEVRAYGLFGNLLAVARNDCLTAQPACPRDAMGYGTGEGYELCRSVCNQTGHAQRNALRLAGPAVEGGVLVLEGHTYACEPCKEAAALAGVAKIVIGP